MSDPLEQIAHAMGSIAEAVDTKGTLLEIKSELAGLSSHLAGHMAQQLAINQRMERQQSKQAQQEADLRERVTRLEGVACQVEPMGKRLGRLEEKVTRWVAWATGIVAVVTLLVSVGVQVAMKFWG